MNNAHMGWDAWLPLVQNMTGLTDDELDGNRAEGNPDPDPCCLDELVDWHRDGLSAAEAAIAIQERLRERTERRGIPALARLIDVGRGHSGQCGRVRRFLIGLYNGSDFPFDLTDLRAVDRAMQQDALAVLEMDMTPSVEVHRRIPGVSEIVAEWAAEAWAEKSRGAELREPPL